MLNIVGHLGPYIPGQMRVLATEECIPMNACTNDGVLVVGGNNVDDILAV